MKMIIGLGNPGKKYEHTRHNVGFMALDLFANQHKVAFKTDKKFEADIAVYNVDNEKVILVKPQTYMNLSGQAVQKIKTYYKVDQKDIIVVVDDINLPVGKLRLREKGSDGGHNGLKDIQSVLGSNDYKRIRVGIGNDTNLPLDYFVLGQFSKADLNILKDTLIDVTIALELFISNVFYVDIMTRFNTQT